jgi:hypothetical protein
MRTNASIASGVRSASGSANLIRHQAEQKEQARGRQCQPPARLGTPDKDDQQAHRQQVAADRHLDVNRAERELRPVGRIEQKQRARGETPVTAGRQELQHQPAHGGRLAEHEQELEHVEEEKRMGIQRVRQRMDEDLERPHAMRAEHGIRRDEKEL